MNPLMAIDYGKAEQARNQQKIQDLQKRLANMPSDEKKLKQACQDFESLFMTKIWQQMRSTLPKEGYLHSKQEEQYLGMFEHELASKMANAGGIGLGNMLYQNLQQSLKNASRTIDLKTQPVFKKQEPVALKKNPELNPLPKKIGVESLQKQTVNISEPLQKKSESLSLSQPTVVQLLKEQTTQKSEKKLESKAETTPIQKKKAEHSVSRSSQENLVVQIALREAEEEVRAKKMQPTGKEVARQAINIAEKTKTDTVSKDWTTKMQAMELASLVIQNHYIAQGGREPDFVGRIEKEDIVSELGNTILPELQWPLKNGRKSSSFGWRNDPFTGERAWHAGVDLAAPIGSSITSCWPGTVSFSGFRGGYGNLVIIDHPGGWQSYYGHTNENLVKVGDKIPAGKEIAKVGNTGRSTGPHLHFELRQGDQAWNPEMILNRMKAGLHIGNKA